MALLQLWYSIWNRIVTGTEEKAIQMRVVLQAVEWKMTSFLEPVKQTYIFYSGCAVHACQRDVSAA